MTTDLASKEQECRHNLNVVDELKLDLDEMLKRLSDVYVYAKQHKIMNHNNL